MKYKNILTHIVVYGIYAACLLLYALFQGSEYDWMNTGAPADVPVTWGDDGSNNRSVFRGVLVASAIGAQLLICGMCLRRVAISTSTFLGIVLIAFR